MWRVATGRSRLIGRIVKSLQTSLVPLNVTDNVSKKVKEVASFLTMQADYINVYIIIVVCTYM